MKRFLTYCLCTLCALCSISLRAQSEGIKARIIIDDIERVAISVNYTDYPDIQNGLNVIDVEPGTTVTVKARENCCLKSVVGTGTDGQSWDEFIIEQSYCELRFYSDWGDTYTVTSARNEEVQNASCTLKVDDASKIKVTHKVSQAEVAIVDGENIIKFDPTTETGLVITPTDKAIYKLVVDGNDITNVSSYSYEVPVVNGTVIEVQANYPDVDCPVHLLLEGDEAADFITGADVDNKPVFNYKNDDFTVKAGASLKLYANTKEWEVDECTINGETRSFFNPFEVVITEETNICIRVHKYATFKVTITVDDPNRVEVYRGYHYNNDRIELKAGDNTVEIMRNTPIVSILPAKDCYLESCQVDDYSYERSDLQISPLRVGSLVDDSHITVVTGNIVRDKQAAIFLQGLEQVEDYFTLQRADQSKIEGLKNGYNNFCFYDYDNDFILGTGSPVEAHVYQNDKKLAPKYPGSYTYLAELKPMDVLKVFFGDAPANYQVTFAGEAEALSQLTVVRDMLINVPGFAAGFSALSGTLVSIRPATEAKVEISVNGEALQPMADGTYEFTVLRDTKVNVTENSITGINKIETKATHEGPVYNLSGECVLNRAIPEAMQHLPKGIYVIEGKKIVR